MTLLVMLFLVLINIFTTTTSISPNVEGLSAMSTWVIVCILFVFGALIGFAIVLYQRKQLSLVIHYLLSSFNDVKPIFSKNYFQRDFSRKVVQPTEFWYGYRLEYIDNALRILFPTLFLVFNIIYWPVCLYS